MNADKTPELNCSRVVKTFITSTINSKEIPILVFNTAKVIKFWAKNSLVFSKKFKIFLTFHL